MDMDVMDAGHKINHCLPSGTGTRTRVMMDRRQNDVHMTRQRARWFYDKISVVGLGVTFNGFTNNPYCIRIVYNVPFHPNYIRCCSRIHKN